MAAQISSKLFAEDGLARPAPESTHRVGSREGAGPHARPGRGRRVLRRLVLRLLSRPVRAERRSQVAEMVVGTSAGAYAGSTPDIGHFRRLRTEFDFFGHFPGLFAKLAPVSRPNISQQRAQEINLNVKDGSAASIRAIGLAALAADNRLNGNGVERLAWTADRRQPDRLAGRQDVYDSQRLLHRRAADRRPDCGAKERHSAGPCGRRQLVAARGTSARPCWASDIAWTAASRGRGRTPTSLQDRSARW